MPAFFSRVFALSNRAAVQSKDFENSLLHPSSDSRNWLRTFLPILSIRTPTIRTGQRSSVPIFCDERKQFENSTARISMVSGLSDSFWPTHNRQNERNETAQRNQIFMLNYTRRRFGGLQPLCGIGVVSLMDRTSIPAEARARTADSRPDPGPLTRTSTERTP